MATFASATRSHFSKYRVFAIILVLLLVFPRSAEAQDSQGVRYIVQPGDTLSSIALRFDVAMTDIITASGISDPNNLHVGDVLIIPGIDWISGTLLIQNVPLGESYLSIKRRYLLTDANMARLNQLTSPEQLYAGFPALFATDRGELTDSGRAAIGSGQSLLEIAAATGDNPWRLAAVNQLPGTWAAIPGDVIFTPNKQSPGPGGLPSEISDLEIQDPGFVQGRTLVIDATVAAGIQLGGDFVGHPLHFFTETDTQQVTLQGIPLDAVGIQSFTISGTLSNGATFTFNQPVKVLSGDFGKERLSITDEGLLDQQLSDQELQRIKELTAPVGDEKMWDGLWGWPHPYADNVTDGFGVFRTYNGGLATGYHLGTDFGGGALLDIYAPAAGKVVFAGSLDVRGNATIIDHGWGVYTAYYHQMEIKVNVGDIVQPGQVIGITGKTGRVNGPHLHWEVWVGGVPVQPLDWLNRIFP